jgi:hypothetical protein
MINYEVGPMADVPPTPADLMAPGRRLWAAVVGKYVLTPTELLILEEAARTADELSRLERAVRNLSRMTAAGSAGQTVAHPLLTEVRRHRALLEKLTAALNLPDELEEAGLRGPSRHARTAANARWAQQRSETHGKAPSPAG